MDSIGIVTTLKASPEDVLRFVNWHLNLGVDHLFLFFDDPSDEIVIQLEGNPCVTCVRCDNSYWGSRNIERSDILHNRQTANATFCLELARDKGLTWLFHMDMDELIYPESDLATALQRAGDAAQIILPPLEAIPETLEDPPAFSASRYFRVLPKKPRQLKLAKLLGARKTFFNGRYFRGHENGKSGCRTSMEISRVRNHRPEFVSETVQRHISNDLLLLHFESNRFGEWEEKNRRVLSSPPNKRYRILKPQLMRYKEILKCPQKKQLKLKQKLYKQNYFINPFQRLILRALGLLRRIDLNMERFNPPLPSP